LLFTSSRPSEEYFFRLPDKYKQDAAAGRWTIIDWFTNPLLLLIAFDVANAMIMVEAARMDIFLIRSSTLFLLMLLRRRFFEQKSGSSRGDDDDDATGKFFIFL
jgi:hypothetical protein